MNWLDWVIIIVPVCFVLGIGMYSRRYIRGVADFLSAGRICGRYVLCVGDVANALSIIGLVAYVEVNYKTGFALNFWNNILAPLSILMALTGYCTYRFRETKAMSLGQFLEMRYSRPFRIFAAGLRSLSEMLANMIMPAIAARFFIYFLDLPRTVTLFGQTIPTFMLIVLLVLTVAISLICMGGTLALIITDSIQGMLLYPLLVLFIVFILVKFSWSNEIVQVMSDRVAGESFLNPYDIDNLRDFNLFFLVVTVFAAVFHRASWIGAGNSTAAKSPHEQKMAGLLGTWRQTIVTVFYVLIAITVLTVLNHRNYAPESQQIRVAIADRIAAELIEDETMRTNVVKAVSAVPMHNHTFGVDKPLSEKANLDTPYLDAAYRELQKDDELGNAKFQQFRTLYNQMMMTITMRSVLPAGMTGLFCLLLILAMISTDDTRIFSASLTIAQDVVLPLRRKPFTPQQHIWVLRIVSIGVGVFFFFGSFFMAQLDYINLFVTLMCTMWLGGCGPVMIFGLYSRFGTTAGAWASLGTGMFMGVGTMLLQRNWADVVYPWLVDQELVEVVGGYLSAASSPFGSYIVWEMNPVKCPINSYEFYFMTMLVTLFLYVVVSLATCRKPFNLDRMLHRGIYNTDGENKVPMKWTFRNVLGKMVGITPEYTLGDKFIAWGIFFYSFVYAFCLMFVGVVIWNQFSPWPVAWWGNYFLWVMLIVPGVVAGISSIWFGIGGAVDLFRMFKALRARIDNPLDDGRVDGNVSLADKALFEQREKTENQSTDDGTKSGEK